MFKPETTQGDAVIQGIKGSWWPLLGELMQQIPSSQGSSNSDPNTSHAVQFKDKQGLRFWFYLIYRLYSSREIAGRVPRSAASVRLQV